MKIIYLEPLPLKNLIGGSQKSLLNILAEMKKRNHEIFLLVPKNGLVAQRAKELGAEVIFYRQYFILNTRLTLFNKFYYNYLFSFINVISLFLTGISIFLVLNKIKPNIVHSNQMLISIATSIGCKMFNIPCVWHIRENPPKHISKYILKIYGLFGYLLSSKVIVNSRYTYDIFLNTKLIERIEIVPIGIKVNVPNFNDNIRENTIFNIGIFGRVIPMKGHKFLINALSLIKNYDFSLSVYGYFDLNDSYYKSLIDLIVIQKLESKVKFLGFKKNVQKYLLKSDLVISASLESESFGRTLVESMALKIPVIGTNVGAHSEIIDDGINGFLIRPNNHNDLSEKIQLIMNNAQLRNKLIKNGRKKFYKKFTLSNYVNNIEKIYLDILPDSTLR